MAAGNRLDLTLRLVRNAERISLNELADRLGVSAMTVRRDLDELARQGLVRRVHGGAVSLAAPVEEAGFAARAEWHVAIKRRIGAAAVDLIQPGQTVLLDAGTTTAVMAGQLVLRAPLTVAVLSLQAAEQLADQPGIRLLVLGGESRAGERSLVGPITLRMLESLWFDCFLMSIGAVHRELGWSEFSIDDATVKQYGIRRAARTIVVADGSKLGVRAFARVGDLDAVNAFVTDGPAASEQSDDAKETLAAIRKAGVDVILA